MTRTTLGFVIGALGALAACGGQRVVTEPAPSPAANPLAPTVIPMPSSLATTAGGWFVVDTATAVVIDTNADAETERVARYAHRLLGRSVVRPVRRLAQGESAPSNAIVLRLSANGSANDEGYTLDVAGTGVTIAARHGAGLFYGVQTLRQLLPYSVEHPAAFDRVLRAPAVHISDAPRFTWRGAMLDVSRHFLPVEDVRRFVDLLALYKLNRLHLHLADDQGWRIEIKSWPNLARYGGSTQVGGGPGGYYTQEQFAALAAYAAERYVTIVPEIDMPGHTNAALASYAGLNCSGQAPQLYTGTNVGFSTLCVTRDSTYAFINDVVREISALTPSPWFHIGGDEVQKLTHPEYRAFVERAQSIVQSNGRTMIGWGEIAPANIDPGTIVQHWVAPDSSFVHAARGGKMILSPSKRAYLDMKYDANTVLGLRWAALIEVRDAYDWDPATLLPGVGEASILGVEGPLWSETLVVPSDWEFMAFPRLSALAEVGWSPASARDWESFRQRLGAHGPRFTALGVNYYRSLLVPWR